jgi:ParB family chromosome partitioning protein
MVVQIPVENISRNPRQPRTHFDPQDLAELEASIRTHGVLQPLVVTRGPVSEQYVLVAGERRWLAARRAGLETVPAILREAGEQDLVELALVENVQRADLEPLEAAEAFRQLVEEFHLSHEEVASRVGKSRVAITNTLRLLKLPVDIQQALVDGKISEGHARALLALPTPEAQRAALKTILEHELNVRQTEELVRKLSGERPVMRQAYIPAPEIAALEDRLRKRLGTRVRLQRRGKGGTVVIHFYSDEELDALIGLIAGDET